MKVFKIDDKLPDICCKGFAWDIISVDLDPDIVATYWGKCENPNCTEGYYSDGDEDSIWYRIKNIEHDSIELVNPL